MSRSGFREFARACLDAMGYDGEFKNSELNDLMADYDEDGEGTIDIEEAFNFLDDFIGSSLDEAAEEEEAEEEE